MSSHTTFSRKIFLLLFPYYNSLLYTRRCFVGNEFSHFTFGSFFLILYLQGYKHYTSIEECWKENFSLSLSLSLHSILSMWTGESILRRIGASIFAQTINVVISLFGWCMDNQCHNNVCTGGTDDE